MRKTMGDTKFHKDEFDTGAHRPRIYSPAVQPLLQSLLATLADLDFDYEQQREKLSTTSPDTSVRSRALEKLKNRHRERREPYIQQLTILQKRMMELRA
jgi:DNA-binding transcriptional MerR regulator